jgi:hypothetical protein
MAFPRADPGVQREQERCALKGLKKVKQSHDFAQHIDPVASESSANQIRGARTATS